MIDRLKILCVNKEKLIHVFSIKLLSTRISRLDTKTRLIVCTCLYLIGVVVGTVIIHESGHIIAALVLGVPLSEIRIGFDGINPFVTIPDRFANLNLAPQQYAGGLGAAFVLLIIYVFLLKRYYSKPTIQVWFMGLIIIATVGMEASQGFLEGKVHALYIAQANDLFGVSDLFVYCFVATGFLLQFVLCPLSKIKKAQIKSATV